MSGQPFQYTEGEKEPWEHTTYGVIRYGVLEAWRLSLEDAKEMAREMCDNSGADVLVVAMRPALLYKPLKLKGGNK